MVKHPHKRSLADLPSRTATDKHIRMWNAYSAAAKDCLLRTDSSMARHTEAERLKNLINQEYPDER